LRGGGPPDTVRGMKTILTFIPPSELISIAFSILCMLGAMAMHALRLKLRSENGVLLLDKLDRLATVVVLEIEQTIVQPAKQASDSGKLTTETATVVKAQAIKRFLALLGDKNSVLRKSFGDVESVAETLIEAKVREMRLLQAGRKVR